MQRDRILRTKPWLKSTDPITIEGKEKSKMNALKVSPELYFWIREYAELMKQQKEICSTVKHFKHK